MANSRAAGTLSDVKLRVYKNKQGTKKVEPIVLSLPVVGSGRDWVLEFKVVGTKWEITNIDFPDGGSYFTYDPATQTVVVSRNTPGNYYEYDVSLKATFVTREGERTEIVELAQGNSSPGVLVDD